MNCKRVFLVGFMCSGKSTVGKLLADMLGWRFVDIDKEVEKTEKMSIPEIFETKGEDYFRRRELEVLKELVKGEGLVISTGGGLGSNSQAMELMKSSGFVVWLRVDFGTFLERCGKDPSRPLLRKSKEELLKLFESRSKIYGKAHLELDGTIDPSLLAKNIIHACRNYTFTL